MNTKINDVRPTDEETAAAEAAGDIFSTQVKRQTRADRRRRWQEADTEVEAMLDWMRARGAPEAALEDFVTALDENLTNRPTPQIGRARGDERVRWAAVPDEAIRQAHEKMQPENAETIGGLLQDLLGKRVEERKHDRLRNESMRAVDDLGSARSHEEATEKGVQHALIAALEMALGRKVLLGERLAEAEDIDLEIMPTRRALLEAGIPKLYAPSIDVEAINVLDQPLPLMAAAQTLDDADVAAALPSSQRMALQAGQETPALGRGPNDLTMQALEREARVREQIFELGAKLRDKGALPDDVNAFVGGLGVLANDQKANKITPDLIQAAFDQLPRGQQTRLAGPLESVIQQPVTQDTVAARTPEMARVAGITLPELLSCLEASGAHILDTHAFSRLAPATGEPMQLFTITRILDQLDPDQTERLVEAFNLAAEQANSPIAMLAANAVTAATAVPSRSYSAAPSNRR